MDTSHHMYIIPILLFAKCNLLWGGGGGVKYRPLVLNFTIFHSMLCRSSVQQQDSNLKSSASSAVAIALKQNLGLRLKKNHAEKD